MKSSNVSEIDVSLPAAPVEDEDGDGELLDEIPIDLNKNGIFLDDYKYPDDPNDPPKYIDGKPRKHIYYLATRDHLNNKDYNVWASKGKFLDGVAPVGFENLTGFRHQRQRIPSDIMESGLQFIPPDNQWEPYRQKTAMLPCR